MTGGGYADHIKKKQSDYDRATKKKPDNAFDKVRKGVARKLKRNIEKAK